MKILLAEDDEETASFLEQGLGGLGHNVVRTGNGTHALELGLSSSFDVFVFDRMLPGTDGLQVLRKLRTAAVSVPALLLTALGRIEDRVEGLEAGADDYLVKPFALSELAARLAALARRRPLNGKVVRLSCGPLTLDLLKREVCRDGRMIGLQPREYRLLEELMRFDGRIVSRTILLESVWGYYFDPQTNIVETHISRLRSKINAVDEPDVIETVRGSGYRMRCLV